MMSSTRAGACASRGLITRRVLQSKVPVQSAARVVASQSGRWTLWLQSSNSQADILWDRRTRLLLQQRAYSSNGSHGSDCPASVANTNSSSSSSRRRRSGSPGNNNSSAGGARALSSTALGGDNKNGGNAHVERTGSSAAAGFATAAKRSSSKSSTPKGPMVKMTRLGKKVVHRVLDFCKRFAQTSFRLLVSFIRNPAIVKDWYEDIRDTVVHFVRWVMTGFRLFGGQLRASFMITKRVVRGYPLTLRERSLLVRTTSDCVKLVPFSFFIIIPFAELALPIFLKFFPNMLPSTFFEQKFDNATLARKLKAKEEMAEFWQQVVLARTKEISESDDHKYADKASELQDFQEKLLEGAEFPTLREILRFSSLFRSELSVQNMSRQQLHAMSRMCGLPVSNTWWPGHLEVQLRHHITDLRREDRDYLWEGIDGLTKSELIEACRKRAIRFHEVTEDDMRHDLVRWLELSANNKEIPTSLLLWIQSFYLREFEAVDEAVSELQMPTSVSDPEPEADEIFLGMAHRQQEKVDNLQRKLEEVQQEIEEVLAEAETQDNKAESRNGSNRKTETEEQESEHREPSHSYAMDEAQEEKKLLKLRMKEQEDTLDLYKGVVAKQSELIDHQLGFLVSMRDNKPTKHKDVDVVLLDQQIRIMEMISDFKRSAADIEQVLADPDVSKDAKLSTNTDKNGVDRSRERRYRTRIGEYIAGAEVVNAGNPLLQARDHQQKL